MGKIRTKFVCQQCGGESLKWVGKCPHCDAWNSLVEEFEPFSVKTESRVSQRFAEIEAEQVPVRLNEILQEPQERLETNINEVDRVLGGGFVLGSLVLLGGEPGIGKSTLLLQCGNAIAERYGVVLYVSAEESVNQIKLRADRLGSISSNLVVLSQTNLDKICSQIQQINPKLVIVDSIQTIYNSELASAPGSVSQVRECATQLMYLAKGTGIAIILVGHVTKDGSLAGPRTLEHLVDTVLYLEGERFHRHRILRSVKNRFGSTNELGIFEMREKGLIEVTNPSEILLSERPKHASGSVVVPSMEGTRPILVEIQALTSPGSGFGIPRRMATGVDVRRVSLLIAVLEKRIGLNLAGNDVFVNVAGGVKIEEPAVDLGIILALASSFRNRPVCANLVAIGEVGLSGEVRSVNFIDKRIQEAIHLGFTGAVMAQSNLSGLNLISEFTVYGVQTVAEALEVALMQS
ncbi:MAG: DNA repair protein RadA [bacterium]|nr:DNA repair protein RadA [bacterium]